MQIESDALNRWARFVDKVRNQSLIIGRYATSGQGENARRLTVALHVEAAQTLTAIESAGAERVTPLPDAFDVPLELLSTAANRRLYYALLNAWEAATEVDKERGMHPHGSADLIADRLARVRQELFGPDGLGERCS